MKPGRLHLPPNVWREYEAFVSRVARCLERRGKSDEGKSGACTRENSRNAARRSLDIGLTYFESARLNCKNIIKCRATAEKRGSANRGYFLAHNAFTRLTWWIAKRESRSGRGTENQRLVIKRKGRIRKRIFIILSASKARRVLAIRTQFNVSGEEKDSLLVIPKVISVVLCRRRRRRWWRWYFTALFSPRSTLHYRICHKLQEVHANARRRERSSFARGAVLKAILSEII